MLLFELSKVRARELKDFGVQRRRARGVHWITRLHGLLATFSRRTERSRYGASPSS